MFSKNILNIKFYVYETQMQNNLIIAELETICHDMSSLFTRIERLETRNIDLLLDIEEMKRGRNLSETRNYVLFIDVLNKIRRL